MRTKIPQLNDFHMDDFEVRDRDAERKEKVKDYGDIKRGATPNNVTPGDIRYLSNSIEKTNWIHRSSKNQ